MRKIDFPTSTTWANHQLTDLSANGLGLLPPLACFHRRGRVYVGVMAADVGITIQPICTELTRAHRRSTCPAFNVIVRAVVVSITLPYGRFVRNLKASGTCTIVEKRRHSDTNKRPTKNMHH